MKKAKRTEAQEAEVKTNLERWNTTVPAIQIDGQVPFEVELREPEPKVIQSPCGCWLSLRQAHTVRGRLHASLRKKFAGGMKGGRPRSWYCGTCPKWRGRLGKLSQGL